MVILGLLTSGLESAAQFLTVLLVFILVLILTYFTTRWVGKFQKLQSNNKNFEVIETCKLTSNKYLQIVRAGKKYLVIAVGKDSVTMLTELAKEDIDLTPAGPAAQDNFQKIFEKAKDKIQRRGDHL
ncbi:MAG TPA: flagellar biosynthetic protein FliO [Lachnospiraceae bacterium]|nr:flagellar biosynthetic protein FliO [Lachnospiraceae bacterium]